MFSNSNMNIYIEVMFISNCYDQLPVHAKYVNLYSCICLVQSANHTGLSPPGHLTKGNNPEGDWQDDGETN